MKRSERRHLFIAGLVYPAFLGNMSYVAAEKIFKEPEYFNFATTLLVLALLLHYVMDWLYTSSARRDDYLPAQLLWDFLIVVCLYVAMRLALNEQGKLTEAFWSPLKEPATWLALTKALAVFWEAADSSALNPRQWFRKEHAGLLIDLGFMAAYVALAAAATCRWIEPSSGWPMLAVVAIADAVGYYLYTRFR